MVTTPITSRARSARTPPERLAFVIWPSVCAYASGRIVGRLLAWERPGWAFLRPGFLFLPLVAPVAIGLYFWKILPFVGRRYQVSNDRVAILRGRLSKVIACVEHHQYDHAEIVVRPGQAWYAAADLVFSLRDDDRDSVTEKSRHQATDWVARKPVLRLTGVVRPDIVRRSILSVRSARLATDAALAREE